MIWGGAPSQTVIAVAATTGSAPVVATTVYHRGMICNVATLVNPTFLSWLIIVGLLKRAF